MFGGGGDDELLSVGGASTDTLASSTFLGATGTEVEPVSVFIHSAAASKSVSANDTTSTASIGDATTGSCVGL